MIQEFQKKFSFEERKAEAERITGRYPDRIPIIAELVANSTLPPLDKHKFLVPEDLSVAQFICILRKRIKLAPEQAIFIFVNNTLPQHSALMSQIYKEHKSSDLFLYFTVAGESTFGF